jgi:hypothetical protein
MTDEQLEDLFQFLTGNWYDRDEDDTTIVREFLAEAETSYIADCINLVRLFIADPEAEQVKSQFIRKSVWHYLPEEENAPIEWLKKMLSLMEKV